ncbi:MAG: 1-acyl-sn-glycerol-3-phosphate acyltransferase [Spartobacteria bacterium]|nr:1-acyl-sn-glycerol-3-phosphate acyltransferase [Spartobacteria bacterium]
MNDWPYYITKFLGQPPFLLSRNPLVVGREQLPGEGACILAPNHSAYYDIALLVVEYPRLIDYVASAELFNKPLARWFYSIFKPIPYRRSRRDPGAVRAIVDRLALGRTVCLFPEGGIQRGAQSVLRGGRIRGGLGRLAIMAQAPVIPVVLLGTDVYNRPSAWLPLHRTRYAVLFGAPMHPPESEDPKERRALARQFEEAYCAEMRRLCMELEKQYPPAGCPGFR